MIYCRGGTAREERAAADQLRTVATKQGWTVVKTLVDRLEAGRTQWATLSQLLAVSEADLLIVPSFVAIADTVPEVFENLDRIAAT